MPKSCYDRSMKKSTQADRQQIINTTLNHIYHDLATPMTLESLAALNHLSPFHFHRLFKEGYGQTVHATLLSIRLQKAASLLLTNRTSTVMEIAGLCGYASHGAFIQAFRKRFGMTPTEWRNGGFFPYSRTIITQSARTEQSHRDFSGTTPRFGLMPARRVAYLRHKGYNQNIRQTWQRLMAFAYRYGIDPEAMQIGLHHDNPTIIPLAECSYVACLEVPEQFESQESLSVMTIPKSYCALFDAEGKYGDILHLMRWIYQEWLPTSGYETGLIPAYILYAKNHFLSEDERFQVTFCLPVNPI